MRWKSAFTASIALAAFSWVTMPQAAAGFRCDTELIRRGMTTFEVQEVCGEPVYEFSFIDFRAPGVFVRVDEWTYELGNNKFRRLLVFENGRLRRVETRDKPGRRSGASTGARGLPGPTW